MKQHYSEEELNKLLPALDDAIATTRDIQKKYKKATIASYFRLVFGILASIVACSVIVAFTDFSSISSILIHGGITILLFLVICGICNRITFQYDKVVYETINKYRSIFHKLEKDVPGIEPPVQLWSDQLQDQWDHFYWYRGSVLVPENRYRKKYIPDDLTKRTELAEKKLEELKEQVAQEH